MKKIIYEDYINKFNFFNFILPKIHSISSINFPAAYRKSNHLQYQYYKRVYRQQGHIYYHM
jgi:hypothetical protein